MHMHTHAHSHAHTHAHTHTQKNDYTVLEYVKQWVDIIWCRIWGKAFGKQVGMTVKAGLSAEDVRGQKIIKIERERVKKKKLTF